MKNFRKVLSKTVAAVYTAHTYGFAIRGHALPMRRSGGVCAIPLYVIKGRNPL